MFEIPNSVSNMTYRGFDSDGVYPTMDQCFPDFDFDQSIADVPDTSSLLPFDFVDCSKSDSLMFYPHLGYDLHTPLINQRKRNDSDRRDSMSLLENDDFQVSTHHLVVNNSKLKNRPKLTKSSKKPYESNFKSTISSQSTVPAVPIGNCEKNRKIFYCRDCGKSFKFQTSLLRHNNKVHNCKYQCPTCHRVFSRQAYLDVHVSKPGSSCFINCVNAVRVRNVKI